MTLSSKWRTMLKSNTTSGTSHILWGSPRWPDVNCCIGGWAWFLCGWEFSCAASLWDGSNAWIRPGDDGYACPGRREGWAWEETSTVSRAIKAGRLVSGGHSRWFSAPHPNKLTRSWTAPFTARNRPGDSSSLTTLNKGAARGYTGILLVEWSVAMQLCPNTAATWWGKLCLPSQACSHSYSLTGSAYRACGEAASALHTMAWSTEGPARGWSRPSSSKRVKDSNWTRVLNDKDHCVFTGSCDIHACDPGMQSMAVSGRHEGYWQDSVSEFLCVPDRAFWWRGREFAQHFSAAQKQTEVIKHILPRWATASTWLPAAESQSAHRWGLSAVSAPAPALQQHPPAKQRRGASCRQAAQPVQAPAKPGHKRKGKRPWDDDPEMEEAALWEMVITPLPPPGRVENLLFCFAFVFLFSFLVPIFSTKERFHLSLGPKRCRTVPLSFSYIASRQQWAVWEQPGLLTHPLPNCGTR